MKTARLKLISISTVIGIICAGTLYITLRQKEEDITTLFDSSLPRTEVPQLINYEAKVKEALLQSPPVLNLLPLSADDSTAVAVSLQNNDFLRFVRDSEKNSPYRNEIFSVRPIRPSDLPDGFARCDDTRCVRVEMFNFTLTIASIAIVDLPRSKVVLVKHLKDLQPEIPEHLRKIAISIASATPKVALQLGAEPSPDGFVMAGTKTALQETACERSQHLCVSPTFVQDKRALWTIVDLTEGRVVGTRWTWWLDTPASPFTEERLRNDAIMENLCSKVQTHEENGWKLSYSLTGSDGILVSNATFNGKKRLRSWKNVDWHVSYSTQDGFGYSDAIGCPLFSAAAVVPAELTQFKEIHQDSKKVGFELHQDFLSKQWPLPCNYFYQNRLQFFDNGSFRLIVSSVGRGCGDNGTYRPVMRFELPFDHTVIERWNGSGWESFDTEGWMLQEQEVKLSPEGAVLKISDGAGAGFFLVPGHGQFNDKGRGDFAYTYITKYHPDKDEGEGDLPTIGPCCNTDYRQGPEKFIDSPPEKIKGERVVFWYVPQLKNDGRPEHEYCWATTKIIDGKLIKEEFPCLAGPLLLPFP